MHWISPVVGCPGCVDYNLKIYGRFARTQIPHSNGWSKGNIFIDLDSGFFHLNFTVSPKIVLYEHIYIHRWIPCKDINSPNVRVNKVFLQMIYKLFHFSGHNTSDDKNLFHPGTKIQQERFGGGSKNGTWYSEYP